MRRFGGQFADAGNDHLLPFASGSKTRFRWSSVGSRPMKAESPSAPDETSSHELPTLIAGLDKDRRRIFPAD